MKHFPKFAAAVLAMAPAPAFAAVGAIPIFGPLMDFVSDVTGPVSGLAVALCAAVVGIIVMVRGGGAAMPQGISFLVGAGVVAWAATAPGTFGVAAGGVLALVGP